MTRSHRLIKKKDEVFRESKGAQPDAYDVGSTVMSQYKTIPVKSNRGIKILPQNKEIEEQLIKIKKNFGFESAGREPSEHHSQIDEQEERAAMKSRERIARSMKGEPKPSLQSDNTFDLVT